MVLIKTTINMAGEYDFKRTSAQIENLLDKIPAEGVVAKVYNTTLDLNGIHRRANKAATHAEVEEVLNIINKYNAGYLVTIADTRDYPFRYGVVSVGMMDDANPITLIHYDDVGDVIAFMLDAPYEGAMWTVTNKTENKIYKTKLSFGSIERRADKAMTKAEYDEVYKIIDKYKAGYVVTVADESDQAYRYGTIAISMQDDAVPTTLVVNDSSGNLIAFKVDDLREGALWTVTDKTSGGGGGNTLFLTTPYLLYEGGDLNASDSAILNSLKGQETKNLAITYCCSTLSGDESVPLKILYDYSQIPFKVTLFYGESSLVISEDENVVGKYIADPPIKVYPYKFPVNLNGSFNINDKNYQFNFNDIKPVIDGWCVFDGSINFYLEGTAYTCSFSIPMNVYRNRPDRNMYNAMAINGLGTISYPVAITFSSGLVFVKVLTSLNVSKIEMNSPACRLIRL